MIWLKNFQKIIIMEKIFRKSLFYYGVHNIVVFFFRIFFRTNTVIDKLSDSAQRKPSVSGVKCMTAHSSLILFAVFGKQHFSSSLELIFLLLDDKIVFPSLSTFSIHLMKSVSVKWEYVWNIFWDFYYFLQVDCGFKSTVRDCGAS